MSVDLEELRESIRRKNLSQSESDVSASPPAPARVIIAPPPLPPSPIQQPAENQPAPDSSPSRFFAALVGALSFMLLGVLIFEIVGAFFMSQTLAKWIGIVVGLSSGMATGYFGGWKRVGKVCGCAGIVWLVLAALLFAVAWVMTWFD